MNSASQWGLWFGLMFNAYEKAHKAYGWLSMGDIRMVMCAGTHGLFNSKRVSARRDSPAS